METNSLFSALADAQLDVQAQAKDATNTFHKYKYTSMEDLLIEARRVLAPHGLAASIDDVTISFGVPYDSKELDKDGNPITITYRDDVLICTCTLRHASGQSISCQRQQYIMPEKGRPPDKALATANTFALGYWLRDLLLIPRVDDEPDRRDDSKYEPRQRQAAPPPRPTQEPPKREELYPPDKTASNVDDKARMAKCQEGIVRAASPADALKLLSAIRKTVEAGEFTPKAGSQLAGMALAKLGDLCEVACNNYTHETDVDALVKSIANAVKGKVIDNAFAQDMFALCTKASSRLGKNKLEEAAEFFGGSEEDMTL
jgi:hypothetical protein